MTERNCSLVQGGQDILSMMGQLMKPKKTEITGKRNSKARELGAELEGPGPSDVAVGDPGRVTPP